MTIKWEGVMPAVTTKFTENDVLDLSMFATNIKAQLDAGVHGIVLGGTLGEASTLLETEKKTLIETTVELVNNKVPVLMNVAEQSTKAAILAAELAEQHGANGLMLLPPMRILPVQKKQSPIFLKLLKTRLYLF